jgi:ribosomal-protein-alanine acetyltransferase
MDLRIATPDDIDGIMAIETPTFTTDAWSAETISSELGSSNTVYLVLTEGDETVAYGGLLAPRGASDADIQTIAVAPAFRRTGLGRRIMVALMRAAVDRGATQLFLEVRADNPNAQALYESLGFAQIAVRPKYYQPDGVDAHIMKAVLS